MWWERRYDWLAWTSVTLQAEIGLAVFARGRSLTQRAAVLSHPLVPLSLFPQRSPEGTGTAGLPGEAPRHAPSAPSTMYGPSIPPACILVFHREETKALYNQNWCYFGFFLYKEMGRQWKNVGIST